MDNISKINSFRLSQDEYQLIKIIEKLLVDILGEESQLDPNNHYTIKEFIDKLNKINNKLDILIRNNLDVNELLPKLDILKISTNNEVQLLSSTTALSPLKLNTFIAKNNFYGLVKYSKLSDVYNKNENNKVVTNNIYNKFIANYTHLGLVKLVSHSDILNCIERN